MTAIDHRTRFSFAVFLPMLALLISASIVLAPAIRNYLVWKAALGNGEQLTLSSGAFQLVLPRDRLWQRTLEMSALTSEGSISVLNAPGRFLVGLASKTTAGGEWFPAFMGPFIWKAISFPLCSLPAWFFAGVGVDGLVLRRRTRRLDLVLSSILVLLSVFISAGLRFGLSESERAGDYTRTYIYGFALWSLLFALPMAAWVRQRAAARVSTTDPAPIG